MAINFIYLSLLEMNDPLRCHRVLLQTSEQSTYAPDGGHVSGRRKRCGGSAGNWTPRLQNSSRNGERCRGSDLILFWHFAQNKLFARKKQTAWVTCPPGPRPLTPRTSSAGSDSVLLAFFAPPPATPACRLVTPDAICNIATLRNQTNFNQFEGGLAFPPACLF